MCQGGLGVGFDFETGRFDRFAYRYEAYCGGGEWRLEKHPDTGIVFSGRTLPMFEQVKRTVYDVCNYVSSLELLGFDIMVSDDGIKICEINTLPMLELSQVMCGPVYADEKFKRFFDSKRRGDFKSSDLYELVKKSELKG